MPVPSILADRFEIEREVAIGGMGHVYRGRDRQTGQPVAVKLINRPDAQTRARFLREATVLAEIEHPGIVRYIAHGQTDDGAAYLAMEWLDGIELNLFLSQRTSARKKAANAPAATEYELANEETSQAELVAPAPRIRAPRPVISLSGELPPTALWHSAHHLAERPSSDATVPPLRLEESVFLGRRLSYALAALHRRGIVHRDVKPGNLFLVDGKIGRLKLLDLGAVWRFDELGRLTRTGHFLGTPMYMAPEQVQNDGDICPATDVWAMGVLLYQCLTGVTPFTGDGLAALLASIVLAAPRPIATLCADIPADLAELVTQMLAKNSAERPASAIEVNERLEAIADALADTGDARPTAVAMASTRPVDSAAQKRPGLTTLESRLTCMLFVLPGPEESGSDGADVADGHLDGPDAVAGRQLARLADIDPLRVQAITRVAEGSGGCARQLFDGTALLTVRGQHSPIEQAALAARMAIAINSAIPDALLVLVTGRKEGERPVQMVANEAIAIGRETRPGTIRLDEMTASLLETRFHLVRDESALYLGEERTFPAARMILGKPSKWFGRRRALATLTATFEECVDVEAARAVLVTGPGGIGKSRLCREFLRVISRLDTSYQLLYGCADMARVGTPFNILAPAMGRYLGLLSGEPDDAARAKIRARVAVSVAEDRVGFVAPFLGAMLGIAFPDDAHPGLHSAQTDHGFRAESIKRAWIEFLRGECARAPVLLIVEELHWGDQPSVEYIDSALATLKDAPFMVLALARPEVEGRFPRLWHKRDVSAVRLHPLSAKESGRLVEDALGADCDPDTVASVVERAGGNPFVLEELVRVVARGVSALPDTVLAIGQDRLAALDPEAKRVLRAASVFGEVFWPDGVQALIQANEPAETDSWLRVLEAGDFILRQARSRFSGQLEYRFEHALIRDAAYALLTDEDRRTGHAVAGAWLEQVGARDPLVLAEHYQAGSQPERAIRHFCQAAEDALAANDLHTARTCAEAAEAAGAKGRELGRVALVQSSVAGWLADYRTCCERGLEASRLVVPGSQAWFIAIGNAVTAHYRLGLPESGRELTSVATSMACEAGAEAHQIVCLCRAGFQEFFDGRLAHGQKVLEQISVIAETGARLDIRTTGQIHSILSLRGRLVGDWRACFQHANAAINVFERAGDIRNHLTERVAFAHLIHIVGRHEEAVAYASEIGRICDEHGLVQLRRQAKNALGVALVDVGQADRAEALFSEVIDEYRELGNRRLYGASLWQLSELLLKEGRGREAVTMSSRAIEVLEGSLIFLSWALAVHALGRLQVGDSREALAVAERAHAVRAQESGHTYRASLVYCAIVAALRTDGQMHRARALCSDGLAYLQASAEQFEGGHRQAFLAAPYNRQLLDLAVELNVACRDPAAWS